MSLTTPKVEKVGDRYRFIQSQRLEIHNADFEFFDVPVPLGFDRAHILVSCWILHGNPVGITFRFYELSGDRALPFLCRIDEFEQIWNHGGGFEDARAFIIDIPLATRVLRLGHLASIPTDQWVQYNVLLIGQNTTNDPTPSSGT